MSSDSTCRAWFLYTCRLCSSGHGWKDPMGPSLLSYLDEVTWKWTGPRNFLLNSNRFFSEFHLSQLFFINKIKNWERGPLFFSSIIWWLHWDPPPKISGETFPLPFNYLMGRENGRELHQEPVYSGCCCGKHHDQGHSCSRGLHPTWAEKQRHGSKHGSWSNELRVLNHSHGTGRKVEVRRSAVTLKALPLVTHFLQKGHTS